jgi:hypothetical protein
MGINPWLDDGIHGDMAAAYLMGEIGRDGR